MNADKRIILDLRLSALTLRTGKYGMLLLLTALSLTALAQETAPPPAVEMNAAEKQFQEQMSNVTMTGFFTVGDSKETHEDRYTIDRVTKIKEDVWNFEARIEYNKKEF